MAERAVAFSNTFILAGLRPIPPIDGIEPSRICSKHLRGVKPPCVWGLASQSLKTKLTQGRQIASILDAFIRTALKEEPFSSRMANASLYQASTLEGLTDPQFEAI